MIHKINTNIWGSNVILKLDMAKAYDRMSWLFILKTVQKFGFGERIMDCVWRILSNCWYSFIMNGNIEGFFSSSKGVRQGDSLYSCIFIIRAEVLSRGLMDLIIQKKTIDFSKPLQCHIMSPISFTDDMIIFANSEKHSLELLMAFVLCYEVESGQLINKDKSCYVVGDKTNLNRCSIIEGGLLSFKRNRFL